MSRTLAIKRIRKKKKRKEEKTICLYIDGNIQLNRN